MLIDKFLPDYHFNEVHGITTLASPERVFEAIKRVAPSEIPLLRTLFTMRSLPAIILGERGRKFDGTRPFVQQALDGGFVLLGAIPGRELALGVIGQFWRATGSIFKVSDAGEFMDLNPPGYAKSVMNFYIYRKQGVTKVRTETRIYISSAQARRKFAAYWLLIQPGSALIRLMWLRAIKRRAEEAGI